MTNADFAKRSAIFIALALTPILIWSLFDVILIIIGALLIATLLDIGTYPFRRIHVPRPLALLASGLLILGILGGAGYLFGASVSSEMQDILQRIEQARQSIEKEVHASPIGEFLISHIKSSNVPVAELVGGLFRISATFVLAVLVTIFAGIYLAAQPALYRDGVSMLFPLKSREEVNETIDHLADGLRLWLLGQLFQMAIIGVLSGFAVWLIGLPSPLALGVIAGVTEFVPYLGPIVAAIPAVLVAVTLSPTAIAWTIAAYVLIHQTEGHLVTPLIQRQMVYIPPAVILFGIAAISSLFGLAGTIFAAPLTVSLFVLIKKLYVRDSLGEATALPGEEEIGSSDGSSSLR
ncbi:AI-2E family transporter [Methylocystis sp. IM3]|uniref:AI-2E family transporter n=1 Tax=Methylocystis sp. IM3 TaxID=3136722 RepID=UPI00311982C7